jgi:cyclase
MGGTRSSGSFDRRALLAAGVGGVLSASLAGRALAAAGAPGVTEIAPGISLINAGGCNVVAARGPDGAVLVDGGPAELAAATVEQALASARAKKVAALINTSWRPERTGANDLIGAQGVPIIAHENTRLWMGTEVWVRWEDKTYTPRAKAARPSMTFYTTGSLDLGREKIDYGYLPQAHTDGDSYVFFRKANVLVCGGMLSSQGWPLIDWSTGGWIGSSAKSAVLNVIPIPMYGGMNPSLLQLVELADDKTIIVPGRGPVMTRAELKAQSAMYTKISERLRDMLYAGKGPSEAVAAAPTREWDAQMGGDSARFVTLAFQSLWAHLTPDA